MKRVRPQELAALEATDDQTWKVYAAEGKPELLRKLAVGAGDRLGEEMYHELLAEHAPCRIRVYVNGLEVSAAWITEAPAGRGVGAVGGSAWEEVALSLLDPERRAQLVRDVGPLLGALANVSLREIARDWHAGRIEAEETARRRAAQKRAAPAVLIGGGAAANDEVEHVAIGGERMA